MTYKYPQDDLDNGNELFQLLGSHWTDVYAGKALVEDFTDALARVSRQTRQNFTELVDTLSVAETPLFHTENHDFLVFEQSKINSADVAGIYYGEPGYFYDGVAKYGEAVDRLRYRHELPENFAGVPLLANRIESPSRVLVDGIDYRINLTHNYIEFLENPFDDDRIPKTPVYEDGEIVDQLLILWGLRAQYDNKYLHKQHGYVFDTSNDSSEPYRRMLLALYRAAVEGTGARSVDYLLEAITGVPLAEGDEVIEVITDTDEDLLVITDKRVYRFNRTATPLHSVGDTLEPGEAITDALRVFDLHNGEVPADLNAVYLDRNWLSPVVYNGLLFSNDPVDLQVTTDQGYTKVTFDVGGSPSDAEAFWAEVHSRGIAAGQTLAHLLDVRENPVGEPGPASLPETVKPLEFLIQNILRGNASIVFLRGGLGPGALGLQHTSKLRKIVPPGTALLFILELPNIAETITMDGPGTDTDPGCEEDVALSPAMEPFSETIDPSTAITEKVRFRVVSGGCQ